MAMGKVIRWGVLATVLGLGMTASWAVIDTGIHMTSDDEFCSSCHSHAPIGSSYREDLHGGNNPTGWRASCAQCHIPHDNSLHYLWVKGIHGIRDPLMELIKEPHDIDWHGYREHREDYVYDSACLSCHVKLEQQTQASGRAFLPHRSYFSDNNEKQCVSCHKHVGHRALGNHLEAMGWANPAREKQE